MRYIILAIVIFFVQCVWASESIESIETVEDVEIVDEFEAAEQIDNIEDIGDIDDLEVDNSMFLKTSRISHIQSDFDSYRLGFIRYSRRGYGYSHGKQYFIENTSLMDVLTTMPIWTLLGGVNRSRFLVKEDLVGDYENVSALGFGSSYSSDVERMSADNRLYTNFNSRRYSARIGGFSSGKLGKSSRYAFGVEVSGGSDSNIDELFSRVALFNGALFHKFDDGGELKFILISSSTERSSRGYITKQSAVIMDDNLYNPYWGYCDGEGRSSSIFNSFQNLAIINYSQKVGYNTSLDVTASFRVGKEGRVALSWGEVEDPRPDYYRYMPGFGDGSYITEDTWKENAQINWEQLYMVNSMSQSGESLYFTENRVRFDLDMGTTVKFTTSLSKDMSFSYGVKGRLLKSSNYKEMEDLMSGDYIMDIDKYMIDNEYYGNAMENNIRDPLREIEEGDKFGYNYDINYNDVSCFAKLGYDNGEYSVDTGLEIGKVTYSRNGLYEKELYKGDESFGRSEKIQFNTVSFMAKGLWMPSISNSLSLSIGYGSDAPAFNDVFFSPRYRNMEARILESSENYGLDICYTYVNSFITLQMSLYATMFTNGMDMYSYYDDGFEEFCNASVYGIDRSHLGVEGAIKIEFNPSLELSTVLGFGKFSYANNPNVDIVSDASQEYLLTEGSAELDELSVGGAPQVFLSSELTYSRNWWTISFSGSLLGNRYVEPVATRRMSRVFDLPSSDKEAIIAQEKLPTAVSFSLNIMKNFQLSNNRLITVYFMVNNLLARSDNIYNAYESSRVYDFGEYLAPDFKPLESRYMYGDGRAIMGGISYRF